MFLREPFVLTQEFELVNQWASVLRSRPEGDQ